MRILTRTTGYYISINSLRPSRIVKSSDDEDTDVRWLDIIPQSTLQGRGILQGQEDNLSPELQLELKDLQQHISDSEAYMVGLDTVKQKILEAKNHDERSKLMTYFVEVERKRLERKKTSRG